MPQQCRRLLLVLCWNITLIVRAFAAVQNINFSMTGFHIFLVF